ncbi:MAG TPA: class I SAM-dependent methyltransferase [Ktedonobacteraceae bacterium]|nr:class I SAM-dependent methyltransferase [Ktedonobacteraceae bacterium]
MQDYYNRRAQEYEQIYHRNDPSRQAELDTLSRAMCSALSGLDVVEVACGTGIWTERVANSVNRILATDASEETLEIASGKSLPPSVQFASANAYDLDAVGSGFTGGLANFWFSHVPKDRVSDFLDGFHARLRPGARVFMADNCYQEGVGGDLVTVPGQADSYKRRYLADGSEHLVLKNYYTLEELLSIFSLFSGDLKVDMGTHYWWLTYKVK